MGSKPIRERKRGKVRSYSEAGVEPEGGAVLVLRPLAQAGPRGANVLARSLAGEDPLVQAACGQNVLLVQAAERQTEGESEQRVVSGVYVLLP